MEGPEEEFVSASRHNSGEGRDEGRTIALQSQVIYDDENDMGSHQDDEGPSEPERLTGAGHPPKVLSGLEERLTTQIQQGFAQAVLQLKEFVVRSQSEHRTTAAGSTGAQKDNQELTVTSHEQPLGIKDSCSDNGSSGSVLETGNRNNDEERHINPSTEPRQHDATAISSQRGETSPTETLLPPLTAGTSGTSTQSRESADVWTKSMQHIVASIERPKPVMPTFTGDSRREFAIFMRRFTGYLENSSVEHSSKLEMLITACTGKLKNSLMSYTPLGPEKGYKEAVKMLRDRLGNNQDHMDEEICELMNGPQIKDNDIKGLQEFIDKL